MNGTGSGGITYFTTKPKEENKLLLEKLREGMQDLAFLKDNTKNPNFEAQALANLNQIRSNHLLEAAPLGS